MEYALLGETGVRVSRLGMGCWALGGHGWGRIDDRESVAAIRRALGLGVILFDTADVYGFGHSEEVLAAALGPDRQRVIIATKGGVQWTDSGKTFRDISPEHMVKALEQSLRRLRIDCIPLYQIHWPDGKTRLAVAVEALRRCQEAGKIRHIGCCNFPLDEIREALEVTPIVSIQVPYNVIDQKAAETMRAARGLGIDTIVYSPLAQGLLSGKYGPDVVFGADDARSRTGYFDPEKAATRLAVVGALRTVGARHGRTPAQVALRWVLANPDVTCALSGAKTAGQLEENADVFWEMPPEDREAISASVREADGSDSPCAR